MSSRRVVATLAVLVAGCGFQPGPRENAPIPPDGLGPYRETGALALCQEGIELTPTGPDLSGFCVPRDDGAPASCETDEQCGSRERCSCGRCVVPYCTGNESCRSNETCALGANLCGVACAVDEDCGAGDACDRGRCAPRCDAAGLQNVCQRGETCSRRRGLCVAIACASDEDCTADERCEGQRSRRALGEPAVVARGDELLLFVADLEAGMILRGRGATNDAFEIEGDALLADARAPAPLADGDGLVLYFARADRTAILRAAGADATLGDVEEVLAPEHSWEGGVVDAPSASRLGGRILLAYEAAGGIGLAVEEGGSFVTRSSPVVTSAVLEDPILWRAVSAVGSPMLLADRTPLGEARLRLWVDARGADGAATVVGPDVIPPPINLSIATLVSMDQGATFTPAPFNPTFARVAELGRYKAESDPWVLQTGDQYLLWFVGGDVQEGTPEGLGVARSGRESLE